MSPKYKCSSCGDWHEMETECPNYKEKRRISTTANQFDEFSTTQLKKELRRRKNES